MSYPLPGKGKITPVIESVIIYNLHDFMSLFPVACKLRIKTKYVKYTFVLIDMSISISRLLH